MMIKNRTIQTYLFCAIHCVVFASDQDVHIEKNIKDNFLLTQYRFAAIIQLFDVIDVDGLNHYPQSRWIPEQKKWIYSKESLHENLTYHPPVSGFDKKYFDRTISNSYEDQWKIVMLYSRWYIEFDKAPKKLIQSEYDDILTSEVLSQAVSTDLFFDPFMPTSFFNYIGTRSEYHLLSAGPDGDYDIKTDDSPTSKTFSEKGWKVVNLNQSYPELSPNTIGIEINPDFVYDPTNGIMSNGDIVFERWKSDSLLIQTITDGHLTSENIIKKPLDFLKQ